MVTLTMRTGLDDLSVRFIINLPQEELATPGRLGFQIEEAHWYYEDFIRPLNPSLPSLNPRTFCRLVFQHCPLLAAYSGLSEAAYDDFLQYKTRVPVRGAILLDQQMNNVVLVKGWKKGAKWSFPRGKINKDEKDLDCAVREVYEETGFDVREAGLIPDDEESVKYIEVSLREQQMRLYVIRGVPMDTHFEPKTRKEISKVEWYKLSDLPTLKKEKQLQQEQAANGHDLVKGSQFYMVAPFLGSLRKWIGEQRRADKAKLRAAHPRGLIIEDDDTTEAEANGRADENILSDVPLEVTDTDSSHMTRLLAGLHSSTQGVTSSSNLPEVSHPSMEAADPALELKRLLSVGKAQQLPVDAPAPQMEEPNPLLALLRGPSSNKAAQEKMTIPPQTPIENITNSPPKAKTPSHRHPRPPPLTTMPPPPHFSKYPTLTWHASLLVRRPYAYHYVYSPLSDLPSNYISRPDLHFPVPFSAGLSPGLVQPEQSMAHPQEDWHPHQALAGMHRPPMHPSNMPPPSQQPFKSYQRPIDFLSSSRPLPQFPGLHSHAIPQASSLPPPKLTSQSLELLNALKSPHEQPQKNAPYEQRGLIPSTILPSRKKPAKAPEPMTSPSSLPSADSATQERQELPTASPPTSTQVQPSTIQPNTGKPRTAHQDALLSLFRSSSSSQQPPTSKAPHLLPPTEPVELSAHHSPHASRSSFIPPPKPPYQRLPALSTNIPHGSPGLTSATVSGPLNAPDFDTVKKHQKISPSSVTTAVPPTGGLVPVEIGDGVASPLEIQAPQPKSFHPQILKRPPQAASASSSARGTPQIHGMGHGQVPGQELQQQPNDAERKSSLLSLLTGPTAKTEKAITPVSPLPDFAAGAQSQGGSKWPSVMGIGSGEDDGMGGRSRISSIASNAEDIGSQSRQVSLTGLGAVGMPSGAIMGKESLVASPTGMTAGQSQSQSNTDFLLGFLQGVAKSAEGMGR